MTGRTPFARTLSVAALLAVFASMPSMSHAQVSAPDTASTSIGGVVTGIFEQRRTPLPHALVEALVATLRRTVLADSLGRYRFEGLPAGEIHLRVIHAGHASLSVDVLVPARADVRVDLELQAEPVELDPVDVLGEPRTQDIDQVSGQPASMPVLEVQSLDLTPGVGHPGLIDAVQSLPGNDPADATDVLYMRGSTTDLKLVLLDGAPVYTPFHVAGLMRSFEPAVLGRAALHVGGAPARYDGGLTHILDLETRRPRRDRVRASGSLDLLAATTALEGPLGSRGGYVASARSLHDLGEPVLRGQRPYGYRDVLVGMEFEPKQGHVLRGTGFWNSEAVLLDFTNAPDDASWSNRAASVNYRTALGEGTLELMVAGSGYRARLPLQPTAPADQPTPNALLATAATDRVRMLGEFAWGPPGERLRVGVSHERIDAAFGARALGGGPATSTKTQTTATGAFLDATRLLGPGLTLRAGLRADAFSFGGFRLAPRVALMWDFDPDAMITVAVGRYHQPTRTPDVEVERTLTEVVEADLPAAALLPVATADHVVVSLDQTLGTSVRLGMQGFWKRYEGLETAPDKTIRSSGIDLQVKSKGMGTRAAVWLGYGLSWFWSTEDLSGYSSDFAGRHLLSAGLSGGLGGHLRGELRVAYGAGLPYTSIPFSSASGDAVDPTSTPEGEPTLSRGSQDSPLVSGLDEEFLRIDLEVHALLRPEWGGRRWTVRPYLRVLNALDRRDALFYTFQSWRSDELTPLAERPFLPVFGVAFSF
jgi:hypothetical protein